MNGEEVYKMFYEIADTSDGELEEVFGMYDLSLIILTFSLEEIKDKWNNRRVG